MARYYKVLKDTPLWHAGAIITNDYPHGYYKPIETSTLWHTTDHDNCLTDTVVQHLPEWFQEVYPVNCLTKTIYKCKTEAIELMVKHYSE
jgi:hypothetical protein